MTSPSPSGPNEARRRRLRLLGVGLALLGAVVITVVLQRRPAAPPPVPELPLNEVDPEVADILRNARDAVDREPRSAAAWGRLGVALFANSLLAPARTCLAQAETLGPTEPRWPYFQGLILLREGTDTDTGLAALQRAAERAGRELAPRLRLAEAYLATDRLDEAEMQFQALREADFASPRVYLGLGLVAMRRGRLREALPYLKEALASPLSEKAARAALAEAHDRLGEREAAEAQRRREAALPPDTPWPDPYLAEAEEFQAGAQFVLGRADTLLAQGKPQEAAALLETFVARRPEVDEAHVKRAQAYLRQNRLEPAEEALRTALKLRPDLVEAQFLLGGVLSLRGKTEEAETTYRQVIERKPAHALAHYNLGRCLRQRGDREGARQAYQAALRYRPDLTEVHVTAAELDLEMGRPVEARAHLEDALRLTPDHEKARQLLAKLPGKP